MKRTAWIVLNKEIRELVRDRRTLSNLLLLGALLGPLLAMGVLFLTVKTISSDAEKTIHLPVSGIEHAPRLVAYLRASGIEVVNPSGDVIDLVRQRKYDAALLIPEDFGHKLRQGQVAQLILAADHSRTRASLTRQRLQRLIDRYARGIGELRLRLRGIDPALNTVLVVQQQDLAPAGNDTRLLMLLPYLLIIGLIQASIVVAADLTAGERERGSLEPLLSNPVAPEQIMLGKLLANLLVCLMVMSLSLFGFYLGSRWVDLGQMGMHIDLGVLPGLFMLLSPLAFLFSALMSLVGAFVRTVKEAHTYLGFLGIAALVPSMMQMVLQSPASGWELLLPIWSHNHLVNELLRGDALSLQQWLLPTAGSLALGAILAVTAARLYRRPGFAL